MPIKNRPDPNYEPPERESFSDGTYKVNGIQWVTTDDSEAPIFKVRKNSASLYAVYKTIVGDKDGPPGSVSPGEVAMLVKAFKADASELPDREQDPTKFLLKARDLINNAGTELDVKVSGGWIQHVPGMSLPENKFFMFEISRFGSKNEVGDTSWVEGTYGKYFGVELVVVGDMYGKPTMYDGATIYENISYPLTCDAEGNVHYETNASGQHTSSTVAFDHFLGAFAPAVFELDFGDPANILPDVEDTYNKDRRRAVSQMVRDRKQRLRLNVGGLTPSDPALAPMPDEAPARDVEDETKEPADLEEIYKLINTLAGGGAFKDGSLTPKGKTWCKENLKGFLKEKGYKASFSGWNGAERAAVAAFLKDLNDEDEF